MFVAKGGHLHDTEPVTSIVPGKRARVVTPMRSYDANSLVITAGAWAGKVLKPLGLNLPLKV